jgi:predicted transcriptional regulator of viral defense system
MDSIVNKVEAMGGTMSANDAIGVSEYMRLNRAVQRGDLMRIRHGVYATPEALLDTMIDVERIVPGGVVCMHSAWRHYGLTTMVPPAFCIAIANKRKVVMPKMLPITLYYWKPENLEFGVKPETISGHEVRITDMERSVCDAVKYRNKIGLDICAEVIRNYLKKRERNLSLLTEYARKLRVANILNTYLEIAIE